MQPLTFTFNKLAQERYPLDQWLFWMTVLWVITADDDRKRERKRRLARQQQQQREDDEQRARRNRPSVPKQPTP